MLTHILTQFLKTCTITEHKPVIQQQPTKQTIPSTFLNMVD